MSKSRKAPPALPESSESDSDEVTMFRCKLCDAQVTTEGKALHRRMHKENGDCQPIVKKQPSLNVNVSPHNGAGPSGNSKKTTDSKTGPAEVDYESDTDPEEEQLYKCRKCGAEMTAAGKDAHREVHGRSRMSR